MNLNYCTAKIEGFCYISGMFTIFVQIRHVVLKQMSQSLHLLCFCPYCEAVLALDVFWMKLTWKVFSLSASKPSRASPMLERKKLECI